jgi:hypothetical protein
MTNAIFPIKYKYSSTENIELSEHESQIDFFEIFPLFEWIVLVKLLNVWIKLLVEIDIVKSTSFLHTNTKSERISVIYFCVHQIDRQSYNFNKPYTFQ